MSLPEKILIANRGEIAVRILRTLRELDVRSVVVHHAVDADSLAVREADEAVELRGEPPVAAYLDADAIVEACRRTDAQAVHPGFGFLAENADFADALVGAGVTFIGPPPAAIRAMGDKIESKRRAALAGVPTVPGSVDAVDTPEAALEAADAVGYPVLLKASAGGGGKGMRIARDAAGCREAFERASGEALASFGDSRLFVERYIERPRHIEVQVLADQHGGVVHLGERECSIQRRFQKVIEESPSPFVDAAMRTLIGEQAVALARAVGYTSAGTVEMVVDGDGNAFFLEMNTRLQVEHPITEVVTGIDIVAEQVRIAAGAPLRFGQEDVRLTGHAVECRIYAEDPDDNFVPAAGRLGLVRLPSGPGIRVDHGLIEGQEVGAAFDPMLAKVIAGGGSRDEAVLRARRALQETVVLGVTTNAAYLERVLAQPAFAAGDTHTGFLEEHSEALVAPAPSEDQERCLVAAGALASPRFDPRFAVAGPLGAMGAWTA